MRRPAESRLHSGLKVPQKSLILNWKDSTLLLLLLHTKVWGNFLLPHSCRINCGGNFITLQLPNQLKGNFITPQLIKKTPQNAVNSMKNRISLHHGFWEAEVYQNTCSEVHKFKNGVIFALRPTVLLIKPVFRFLHQNTSICTPKWSGWSGDFKETILDRFWSDFGPILVDFDRFLPQNAHQNDWDKVGIISKTIWTNFDDFRWILTNFWCMY